MASESENSVKQCELEELMDLQFDLSELKTPSDYRAEGRTHVFPSAGSLDWFIRKNKGVLYKEKALIKPAGKMFVVPKLFDQVVLVLGSIKSEKDSHESITS